MGARALSGYARPPREDFPPDGSRRHEHTASVGIQPSMATTDSHPRTGYADLMIGEYGADFEMATKSLDILDQGADTHVVAILYL